MTNTHSINSGTIHTTHNLHPKGKNSKFKKLRKLSNVDDPANCTSVPQPDPTTGNIREHLYGANLDKNGNAVGIYSSPKFPQNEWNNPQYPDIPAGNFRYGGPPPLSLTPNGAPFGINYPPTQELLYSMKRRSKLQHLGPKFDPKLIYPETLYESRFSSLEYQKQKNKSNIAWAEHKKLKRIKYPPFVPSRDPSLVKLWANWGIDFDVLKSDYQRATGFNFPNIFPGGDESAYFDIDSKYPKPSPSSTPTSPKVPENIKSMTAWLVTQKNKGKTYMAHHLGLGTSSGKLLVLSIRNKSSASPSAKFIQSVNTNSKSAITYLEAVPAAKILLALSGIKKNRSTHYLDGKLYTFDLANISNKLDTINPPRKDTIQCIAPFIGKNARGNHELSLCIGTKKFLYIYRWNPSKLKFEPKKDRTWGIPAPPKSLAWVNQGKFLAMGYVGTASRKGKEAMTCEFIDPNSGLVQSRIIYRKPFLPQVLHPSRSSSTSKNVTVPPLTSTTSDSILQIGSKRSKSKKPNTARGESSSSSGLITPRGKIFGLFGQQDDAPSSSLPHTVSIPESKELLVIADSAGFIYDGEGEPNRTRTDSINWSDTPIYSGIAPPSFAVAIFDSSSEGAPSHTIEIRDIHQGSLVQTVSNIKNVSLFTNVKTTAGTHVPSSKQPKETMFCEAINFDPSRAIFFATTDNTVYQMVPEPLVKQIDLLIQEELYEKALSRCSLLADCPDFRPAERTLLMEAKLAQIRKLFGYSLFLKGKYSKAMEQFTECQLDVRRIMVLFPDKYLPDNVLLAIKQYPAGAALPRQILPPSEPLKNIKKAIGPFIRFLQHRRNLLRKHIDLLENPIEAKKILEDYRADTDPYGHPRKIAVLVDTTVLQLYVLTSPSLVASFIRLPHTRPDLSTSIMILAQADLYDEIVLLYQSRSFHKEGLLLLEYFGNKYDPPKTPPVYLKSWPDRDRVISKNPDLAGPYPTIKYLQTLNSSHLDLILNSSAWILKYFPKSGLEIFTGDAPGIREIDTRVILHHIKTHVPHSALNYLEFLVNTLDDDDEEIHTELALVYLSRIQRITSELNTLLTTNGYDPLKDEGASTIQLLHQGLNLGDDDVDSARSESKSRDRDLPTNHHTENDNRNNPHERYLPTTLGIGSPLSSDYSKSLVNKKSNSSNSRSSEASSSGSALSLGQDLSGFSLDLSGIGNLDDLSSISINTDDLQIGMPSDNETDSDESDSDTDHSSTSPLSSSIQGNNTTTTTTQGNQELLSQGNQIVTPSEKNMIDADTPVQQIATISKQLAILRESFKAFLNDYNRYDTERVLSNFPKNYLYDDLSIVYRNDGRLRDALELYIYRLGDIQKAYNYCDLVAEDGQDLYLDLLELFLYPKENSCQVLFAKLETLHPSDPLRQSFQFDVGGGAGSNLTDNTDNTDTDSTKKPNFLIGPVIEVLQRYGHKMDVLQVLKILPKNIPLNAITPYLHRIIREYDAERRTNQIEREIAGSALDQSLLQLHLAQDIKLVIFPDTLCTICKAPIGNTTFVRQPDGKIQHFGCYEKQLKSLNIQ